MDRSAVQRWIGGAIHDDQTLLDRWLLQPAVGRRRAKFTTKNISRALACVALFFIGSAALATENTANENTANENTENNAKTKPDSYETNIKPLLEKHCITCHGSEDATEGDVNLLTLTTNNLTEDPELLQSIVDVLDLQEMPPEDEPELAPKDRRRLLARFRVLRDTAVKESQAEVSTPIRRMNRFQYNNAVTDLFQLRCIVFTLPERMMREHNGYFRPETGKMADVVHVGSRPLGKSQMIEKRLAGVAAFPQDLRAEHGFDNRGDHLSLSPLLMQAFLDLGQSITQSPDFVRDNVGIWDDFFAPPETDAELNSTVRARIEPFLSRAFRRPVSQANLNRYANYVVGQVSSGVAFTDAMKSVAAAVIASPRFLYLYDTRADQAAHAETTDGTKPHSDDITLASRLSFFLWGSVPDDALLELAAAGKLREQKTLLSEVDRMLKNRKLKRFCDSFPSQWLQLERIISSSPDPEKFTNFYFSKYRDSMHMMLEPLLLFETVLIEDQPITQFLDSDFTYRSFHLEDAYGQLGNAPGPNDSFGPPTKLTFRRVAPKDRRTGGLITNTAVMTMTSGPERTQPITRGAWLAGVVFNNPPEPPPADVPALGEKPPQGEEHLTLRERLSQHRERSDCKGCHEQIDPLGFALENYDPVGVWRETYENTREVDMQGTLLRKHSFNNVVEFKDALLQEKDRFTRALAGHLLSYALGRELAPSDQISLDRIAKATAADHYRMQTLIKQVILSKPFRGS